MSAVTHDEVASRDLVFEGLVDAAGAAKIMGDQSVYLAVEILIEARENGTLGSLVRELEMARTTASGDHPAIAASVARRMAIASQEVCS